VVNVDEAKLHAPVRNCRNFGRKLPVATGYLKSVPFGEATAALVNSALCHTMFSGDIPQRALNLVGICPRLPINIGRMLPINYIVFV
jgi:hypothetical protein